LQARRASHALAPSGHSARSPEPTA
jgi:hypothetical protein